ncbi:MAG: hypothetical protein HYV40_04480 [Candidatus Levybacteria bacterium]|nr:hypothetical protein [Candidatus Levybacteria bacterium]
MVHALNAVGEAAKQSRMYQAIGELSGGDERKKAHIADGLQQGRNMGRVITPNSPNRVGQDLLERPITETQPIVYLPGLDYAAYYTSQVRVGQKPQSVDFIVYFTPGLLDQGALDQERKIVPLLANDTKATLEFMEVGLFRVIQQNGLDQYKQTITQTR